MKIPNALKESNSYYRTLESITSTIENEEVSGIVDEAPLQLERNSTVRTEKIRKKCSVWDSNSFISGKMMLATLKLSVVNVFLLISIFSWHVKVASARRWADDAVVASIRECRAYTSRSHFIIYFGFVNMLLGLPATGIQWARMYRVKFSVKGRLNGNVEKTYYLRMCEIIVAGDIVCLLAALYLFLYDFVKANMLYDCWGLIDNWLVFALAGQTILVLFAFALNWYQIIIFHRMRDHFLFQCGVLPSGQIFNGGKARHRHKSTNRNAIKAKLIHATETNNVILLRQALVEAAHIDGHDFCKKWYKIKPIWFGLMIISTKNPMHVACASRSYDALLVLLEYGFDVNELDRIHRFDFTLTSLYEGLFNIVIFLRKVTAKGKTSSHLGDRFILANTTLTALHVAVAVGDMEATNILIKFGADVNKIAKSNLPIEATPPLFWSSSVECTEKLISANANLLAVGKSGFSVTPYQAMIMTGKLDIAANLKKWGADIALTPLHMHAASGNVSKLRSLLRSNADPNTLGEQGCGLFCRTPLHWSAMRNEVDAIAMLMLYGASVDAVDTRGMTPLAWACSHNHEEAVLELLRHGANPNSCNNKHQSVMFALAHQRKVKESILFELVSAGGDINCRSSSGDTPLHVAMKLGYKNTAISLLHAGADPMLVNSAGYRAMDCTSNSDLRYAVKKEAGSRDVMISYTHTHSEFALKVKNALEDNHITTWFDSMDPSGIGGGAVWREEVARGIMNASVVVCILSTDFPESQWCMKELALAKQYNVPVMAVCCEHVDISSELQAYLYTRQIIDFQESITNTSAGDENAVTYTYDEECFQLKMHLLHDGLHDEIEEKRIERCATNETFDDTTSLSSLFTASSFPSDHFLFLCHGDAHGTFVAQLKQKLNKKGYSCFVGGSSTKSTPNMYHEEILQCAAFAVILSSISSANDILSDQLAFAEDHGKRIIPIILSTPVLDHAKEYTLSRSKLFHFAHGIGFDDSFSNLFRYIHEEPDHPFENPVHSPIDTQSNSNTVHPHSFLLRPPKHRRLRSTPS